MSACQSLSPRWNNNERPFFPRSSTWGTSAAGRSPPSAAAAANRTATVTSPGQPAHGPNYRLTKKVNGKTVSETFASPAEQRKAQREVEAYHRFRELSRELLAVNDQICRLRPVEERLTGEETKRPKRSSRKSPRK